MRFCSMSTHWHHIIKCLPREQPLSNEFIKRFELPSTSSVKSALSVLVDKDLVYQTSKGYIIYDRFLGLWLKRL